MLIMMGHDTKDKGERSIIEFSRSLRLRTETKHHQKSHTVGRRSDFRGQAGQGQCSARPAHLPSVLAVRSPRSAKLDTRLSSSSS